MFQVIFGVWKAPDKVYWCVFIARVFKKTSASDLVSKITDEFSTVTQSYRPPLSLIQSKCSPGLIFQIYMDFSGWVCPYFEDGAVSVILQTACGFHSIRKYVKMNLRAIWNR